MVSVVLKVLHRRQFCLRTLLLLVALLAVALGAWAHREHEYRARLSAVSVLQRELGVAVYLRDASGSSSAGPPGRLLMFDKVLGRDDIVVGVNVDVPVSDEM